jgi:hypothetical protein
MYAVRGADRGLAVSSLRVHLAAIQTAHRLAGIALDLRDGRLAQVLEGITRTPAPAGNTAPATRPKKITTVHSSACGEHLGLSP